MPDIQTPGTNPFSPEVKVDPFYTSTDSNSNDSSDRSSGTMSNGYTYDEGELRQQLTIVRGHLHVRIDKLDVEVMGSLQSIYDCARSFATDTREYREVMNIIYSEIKLDSKDIKPFTPASMLVGCRGAGVCDINCVGSLIEPGSKLCEPFGCLVTGISVHVSRTTNKKTVCMEITASEQEFQKSMKLFMAKYGSDIVYRINSIDDTDRVIVFNENCLSTSDSKWLWFLIGILIILIIVVLVVYLMKRKREKSDN